MFSTRPATTNLEWSFIQANIVYNNRATSQNEFVRVKRIEQNPISSRTTNFPDSVVALSFDNIDLLTTERRNFRTVNDDFNASFDATRNTLPIVSTLLTLNGYQSYLENNPYVPANVLGIKDILARTYFNRLIALSITPGNANIHLFGGYSLTNTSDAVVWFNTELNCHLSIKRIVLLDAEQVTIRSLRPIGFVNSQAVTRGTTTFSSQGTLLITPNELNRIANEPGGFDFNADVNLFNAIGLEPEVSITIYEVKVRSLNTRFVLLQNNLGARFMDITFIPMVKNQDTISENFVHNFLMRYPITQQLFQQFGALTAGTTGALGF
jgi:hypothetical protein